MSENKRFYNRQQTKAVNLEKIRVIENKDKIIIEGNKQRINIMVNSGLWKELGKFTSNKSNLVENLVLKYLEKLEDKEIILRKSEF